MSLYSHISAVYDDLFPIDPVTVDFVESIVPKDAERRLLDLGAATGGHVEAFANRGWDTLGIELDEAMASAAALKSHVVLGSMLDAESLVVEDYGVKVHFGAVLCLGNTLPHIPAEKLHRFFSMVRRLLHPGAPFVIQTLNYANPETGPGFIFPKMERNGYSFERRYKAGKDPGTIQFLTRFSREGSSAEDVTILYPHTPETISAELAASGFAHVSRMSGWGGKAFDINKDRYLVTVGK